MTDAQSEYLRNAAERPMTDDEKGASCAHEQRATGVMSSRHRQAGVGQRVAVHGPDVEPMQRRHLRMKPLVERGGLR